VVEAVRAGRFHVWAVHHVDEGIEVVTGVPAGQRRQDGSWPDGTVNGLVDRRLHEMAEKLRTFARPEEKNDKN
jgi:predicted ATP-dependent protease